MSPYLLAIIAASVFGLLILLGFLIVNCYSTCEQDEAIVRTGAGGPRVAIGGGMWKLPVVHNVSRVTLRTLKLDVKAGREHGAGVMRSKDMLPIVLDAEIYVRVPQKEEYVLNAARTLGEKADPKAHISGNRGGRKGRGEDIKDFEEMATKEIGKLTEQKLRSGIRSAIATMTLSEAYSDPAGFQDNVSRILEIDLKENGLELETVAIEDFKQESLAHLEKTANSDVQDAMALRTLKTMVETEATKINEVAKGEDKKRQEQDTNWVQEISVLQEHQRSAVLIKERNIANKEEETEAEKDQFRANIELEKTKIVENAEFEAGKITEETAKNLEIFEKECERDRLTAQAKLDQESEAARLQCQRDVETLEQTVDEAIKSAEIDKQQNIGVRSEQMRKTVDLSSEEREQEVQRALVITNQTKAETASAEEKIQSAKFEEQQRRDLIIPAEVEEQQAGIKRREAEIAAETLRDQERIAATAEKEVKLLHAEAEKLQVVLQAEAEKQAENLKGEAADAILAYGRAEAEARLLEYQANIVKAESELLESDNVLNYYIAKNMPELISALPKVVEAVFKPMEKIEGMRIHQVNVEGGNNSNPMTSLLKNFAQAAPAAGLINELLQMGGGNKSIGEVIENATAGLLGEFDKFPPAADKEELVASEAD